jgi:hypothetical protein
MTGCCGARSRCARMPTSCCGDGRRWPRPIRAGPQAVVEGRDQGRGPATFAAQLADRLAVPEVATGSGLGPSRAIAIEGGPG